jgi:integrative and conjugative element protein (TIGR02256 family)
MNIEFRQPELGIIITIQDSVLNHLISLAKSHLPNEFGGVLIGEYSDNGMKVNITSFILPSAYSSTSTSFKREPERINQEIEHEFQRSNGKIIYIGEWHSHPNGSSQYSNADFTTMKDIQKQPNVRITHPLLLIIGIEPSKVSVTFYVMFNNKLLKYEPTFNC